MAVLAATRAIARSGHHGLSHACAVNCCYSGAVAEDGLIRHPIPAAGELVVGA
jgi:hypothetical protein